MFLSIIIPVYKVEKFIEKCIISCANQDVDPMDYEIIVVNDGSPDESATIARTIASKHNNIHVIDRLNGGLSAARNTGMEAANGDYYFFVDSDDWIHPNCLSNIFKILESEKPDVLYIGAADYYDGVLKRRNPMHDTTTKRGKDAMLFGLRPEAQLSIVRASFMKNNNFTFLEGILHEDSELTHRMHYKADSIAFYDEIIYYFFPNPNSITRSVNPKKCFDIIQYVCPNLSSFSDTQVEDGYKVVFHNLIAMYINNALAYSNGINKEHEVELSKLICDNKYLFRHLLLSKKIKYIIEYFIFMLFPGKTINLYRLISR